MNSYLEYIYNVRVRRLYQGKNRNVDDGRACSWENEWLMKYPLNSKCRSSFTRLNPCGRLPPSRKQKRNQYPWCFAIAKRRELRKEIDFSLLWPVSPCRDTFKWGWKLWFRIWGWRWLGICGVMCGEKLWNDVFRSVNNFGRDFSDTSQWFDIRI